MVLESDDIKDIDIVIDIENGGIRLANFFYEKGLLLREPVVYERFGTSMFVLKEFMDIPLETVHTRSEQYQTPTAETLYRISVYRKRIVCGAISQSTHCI